MNTVAIIWLLVAATSSSYSSPTVIYEFSNEQQCEASAADLAKRSRARRDQSGRYFTALDGVCIPVPANVDQKKAVKP